jgi:hypothetical protein
VKGGAEMKGFAFKAAVVFLLMGLIAIAGGCIRQGETFDKLLGEDAASITKIEMRCGTTGDLSVLDDEETVAEFVAFLMEKKLNKADNQEKRTGYSYYADLYKGSEKALRVTFQGNLVVVDETCYEVGQEISKDRLDSFFLSAAL